MAILKNNCSKPALVDAINAASTVVASGTNNSSGNQIYGKKSAPYQFLSRVGKIVSTGPKGDEDDYTDGRYWVKLQVNQIATTHYKEGDPLTIADAPNTLGDSGGPQIITAFLAADVIAGTHSMSAGQMVSLLPVTFDAPQDNMCMTMLRWQIVSGGSSGTGQYQGQCNMNVTDDQEGSSFLFFHEDIS